MLIIYWFSGSFYYCIIKVFISCVFHYMRRKFKFAMTQFSMLAQRLLLNLITVVESQLFVLPSPLFAFCHLSFAFWVLLMICDANSSFPWRNSQCLFCDSCHLISRTTTFCFAGSLICLSTPPNFFAFGVPVTYFVHQLTLTAFLYTVQYSHT
jgi:hypothetical protein